MQEESHWGKDKTSERNFKDTATVNKPNSSSAFGKNGRKHKPTELNSPAKPEPTRMRTTGFIRVTTTQLIGATADSCLRYSFLATSKDFFSIQEVSRPQRQRDVTMSSKNSFKADLPLYACGSLVGICQTYLRLCVQREEPKEDRIELSAGSLCFLPF